MTNLPLLLTPMDIRGVTLPNRVVLSPLCMYSAEKGVATDWQFAHLSAFARGGVGLVFTEATAVEPRGRITPRCLGIWTDEQAEVLKPVTKFIESMGSVPGIQLAHAGRKASASPPWDGGRPLTMDDMSWGDAPWRAVGPSELPVSENWQAPHMLSGAEIAGLVDDFATAARRSLDAGFKVAEIHGAHGYLIHSFLSPISNNRNDVYGGDRKGRTRFALEVTEAVRAAWPDDLPLFFRVSAVDFKGWDIRDTVALASELKDLGIDVVDCSAGGISGAPAFRANDDGTPVKSSAERPLGFQVPYAQLVREGASIMTMAVGRIVEANQAEEILASNRADLIAIGRELMYDPFWTLHAAETFGIEGAVASWPEQDRWAIVRRAELELGDRP